MVAAVPSAVTTEVPGSGRGATAEASRTEEEAAVQEAIAQEISTVVEVVATT